MGSLHRGLQLCVPLKNPALCSTAYVCNWLFRSSVQQASEAGAEGNSARAEWRSLAGLLAQAILAHLPSIPDQVMQHRIAAVVKQLLLLPSAGKVDDRYVPMGLFQTTPGMGHKCDFAQDSVLLSYTATLLSCLHALYFPVGMHKKRCAFQALSMPSSYESLQPLSQMH